MSAAVRIVIAVAAAAVTLAIGRAAAAHEENHPMSPQTSVGVGLVLFAVYITIALSV